MAQPLFDLEKVVAQLAGVRQEWRTSQQRSNEPGGRELPSRDALSDILRGLKGVLFPMRLGPTDLRQESEDFYVGHTLGAVLHALHAQVRLELHYTARHAVGGEALNAQALAIARDFANALPAIRRLLDSDVIAAFEGDPAARSVDEVLLCYPGILAMITTAWRTACMHRACRCWRALWPNWPMPKPASTSTPAQALVRVFS